MSQWPMVKLGDVCERKIPKWDRNGKKKYIDISTASPETKTVESPQDVLGEDAPSRAQQIIQTDDVLVSTVRPNLNTVAKIPSTFNGHIASTGFCVLRATEKIDPGFLFHFVQTQAFIQQCINKSTGISYPSTTANKIREIQIPLPTLEEQRRIAHILEAAQKNISAAKFKSNQINSLRNKISNLYSTDNSARTTTLSSIAEITSGITKGRKIKDNAPLTDTPYLAVSNVKDGYLDLSTVSSIPITAIERDRYLLKSGDILLTEGGDPDKLGRGAIWKEEIAGAIHQNHIFKVRLKKNSNWNDNALLAVIRSDRSRAHFFRSAKQTTGIATINKRQLSATPIPELSTQTISLLSSIEEHINHLEKNINKEITLLEELHQSLATRAFAGQL